MKKETALSIQDRGTPKAKRPRPTESTRTGTLAAIEERERVTALPFPGSKFQKIYGTEKKEPKDEFTRGHRSARSGNTKIFSSGEGSQKEAGEPERKSSTSRKAKGRKEEKDETKEREDCKSRGGELRGGGRGGRKRDGMKRKKKKRDVKRISTDKRKCFKRLSKGESARRGVTNGNSFGRNSKKIGGGEEGTWEMTASQEKREILTGREKL